MERLAIVSSLLAPVVVIPAIFMDPMLAFTGERSNVAFTSVRAISATAFPWFVTVAIKNFLKEYERLPLTHQSLSDLLHCSLR